MNIGFALIIGEPFFSDIVSVENDVHDVCGFQHKLEKVNNIPHTTLFQGSFRNDVDYVRIVHGIRDFFLYYDCAPFLNFCDIIYMPHGWYFYACEKTDELDMLHRETLRLCQDNIVLSENRFDQDLSMLTVEQLNGIRKYGYMYSEDAFLPHITIGRSIEDKNDNYIELLNDKLCVLPKVVRIERITAYCMGENGMHTSTLFEVNLF